MPKDEWARAKARDVGRRVKAELDHEKRVADFLKKKKKTKRKRRRDVPKKDRAKWDRESVEKRWAKEGVKPELNEDDFPKHKEIGKPMYFHVSRWKGNHERGSIPWT